MACYPTELTWRELLTSLRVQTHVPSLQAWAAAAAPARARLCLALGAMLTREGGRLSAAGQHGPQKKEAVYVPPVSTSL